MAGRLEISNLLEQSAYTLSGGEKQKTSIARALISEPEILFVDEATTNLDEESIYFFNSHFADLVTDEMTVVMVSHDRRQIKELADQITLLKGGKVKTTKTINDFNFELFGAGIETFIAELV
jgi:tungstate transport system ATP-binding protein